MPLSDFLRMARGNVESAEQNSTNYSTDLSSVHENDLVELVWNNGQIMTQGHSNRARKNPSFNELPSEALGMRDNRYLGNASNLKAGKFAAVQSLMDDVVPSVPSTEILNHDNDIEPWLNSSIHDNVAQAYFADLLPEISSLTGNEPSLNGSFASMDKRNGDGNFGHLHNVPMNIRENSELQNSSNFCSSSLFNPYETNQGESSVPLMSSRVLHIDSSIKNSNVCIGDSNQGQTSENAFMSMLPEKQSMGKSDSGSRVLNFTNFSRPAAMHRSNLQKSDGLDSSCSSAVKRTQNGEKSPAGNSCIPVKSALFQSSGMREEMGSCNKIKMVSMKADSGPSAVRSPIKPCPAEPPDSVCHEDSNKNDKLPGCGASLAKGFTVGDNIPEPLLAASSVCSGNSAEMASNDQTHKRKDRDNGESDSRSEDNEEESVGRKKATPARGVSGSKRSRAAEVHNLSERRRRDRINEKMRALQELIPSCNKADKASMLDEAIDYLKTLQHQVQVMSMGTGFCMPPVMFPTAMPHMHATHMTHFPPMGGGMGFGMGMLDMNSGTPRFPVFPISSMQGRRFPSPHMYGPSTYQGLAGQNYQFYGHPGQGIPLSVPRAPPLFPSSGKHPVSSTGVSHTQRVGIHVDAPKTSQVISTDSQVLNNSLQPVSDACGSNTMDHTPSQSEAANVAFDHPFPTRKDDQVLDACGSASVNLTSTKDDVSSKEGVGYRE